MKYVPDLSLIIQPQVVDISDELTYEERPVQIVDTQIRQLRTKRIPMVKVLWRSQSVEECTWETEEDMRQKYPYLFIQGMWLNFKFEDEFILRGGDCNTPKYFKVIKSCHVSRFPIN